MGRPVPHTINGIWALEPHCMSPEWSGCGGSLPLSMGSCMEYNVSLQFFKMQEFLKVVVFNLRQQFLSLYKNGIPFGSVGSYFRLKSSQDTGRLPDLQHQRHKGPTLPDNGDGAEARSNLLYECR